MSIYFRILFSLFVVFSLLYTPACQDANPSKVSKTNQLYADYFIRYLSSEKQLRAEATFAEGDSIQNAKAKTFPSVFFQGGAMDLRDLGTQGIRYKAERSGADAAEYTFLVKDEAGQEKRFTMSLPSIDSFLVEKGASLSNGLLIKWMGQPLSNDEDLVIMLTDKDSKANVIQVEGPTEDSQVDILPGQLSNMATGQYTVYLVRKQSGEKNSKHNYTTYSTEYYTSSQAFTLNK